MIESYTDRITRLNKTDAIRNAKEERVEAWARDNLKVDMFVQVTGARDGLGLRKIIELRNYCFVGRVYRNGPPRRAFSGGHLGSKRAPAIATPDNFITEHLFKKLKAVWINDEWVNIANLTKETK